MSSLRGQKPTGFLHCNIYVFDDMSLFIYDIKKLCVMQKARALLAHLNWTCRQGNGDFSPRTFMTQLPVFKSVNAILKMVYSRVEWTT